MDHLQSMRVFVKVADLGSFSKAALELQLSKAVVTRNVADLEGKLNTRLLSRTTRSFSVTEMGRVYLDKVRRIIDQLEDVEQMVLERTHEPVGTLRLVVPVTFGLHHLAPVLDEYTRKYPLVIPDISLVEKSVDLVGEGFDVGIMIGSWLRGGSLISRRLLTGQMLVCATPGYLATHGTPRCPEDLLEHAYLSLPTEGPDSTPVFAGPAGEARLRARNVMTVNNTEILRQLTLRGAGIAILPSYLVAADLACGQLTQLMPEYRLAPVDVVIAYASRSYMPSKVRSFIDHLVGHFGPTA